LGTLEKREDFTVAERESKTVPIAAPTAGAASEPPPAGSKSWAGEFPLEDVLVYGGFGLGGVGLALGATFGALSMSGVSKLKNACPNNACAPARRGDLDTAKSEGTVSTIAFAAGGLGIGAGILGLVLKPKSGTAAARASSRTPRIGLELSPVGATVVGNF
jgi:hypothetical protein